MRRALRGTVPDFILDAPKKGFTVPYGQWLKGPLSGYSRELLLSGPVVDSGLFDQSSLEHLIDEHVDGEKDNKFLIYKLLQFAVWYREYVA